MNALHRRIAASFGAQGLMATLGAELAQVAEGEVRAFAGPGDAHKVIALMQATIVNVAPMA